MKTTLPTDIELTIPQGTKLTLTLEGNLILWMGISQSHDFPAQNRMAVYRNESGSRVQPSNKILYMNCIAESEN